MYSEMQFEFTSEFKYLKEVDYMQNRNRLSTMVKGEIIYEAFSEVFL